MWCLLEGERKGERDRGEAKGERGRGKGKGKKGRAKKGRGQRGKGGQDLRPPMACTLSQRSDRDCSSPAAQSLRQLGQCGVSRMVSRGAHTPRATTLCSTASDLTLQFLYQHTTDVHAMGTASWRTTHAVPVYMMPAATQASDGQLQLATVWWDSP